MKITTRYAFHFISASDDGFWQSNSRLRVIPEKSKKNMAPLHFADHVTKINIGPGYENGFGSTRVCV